MKTLFLLSHTPNPRAMKRVSLLHENRMELFLIYAKRKKSLNFTFLLPNGIRSKEIMYNDKRLFFRIISLTKFVCISTIQIKKFKPDFIHLTNLDMLICAVFYKTIFDRKVKLIYEVADISDVIITQKENILTRMIKKIEKSLCRKIYRLILTSQQYYSAYYNKMVPKEKVFFMPNVPSRKVFKHYKAKEYNNNEFTIGFIGYIRYPEVLKILIDVTKELSINLLLAGDGIDKAYLERYANGINALNVKFTGKYDYEKEIVKLYEKIDVVYSAYDNRSNNCRIAIPNRLYEAIACELPLIVAKDTFLSEIVKKLDVGIEVDPFDKKDIIVAISKLRDRIEIKRIKANCRKVKNRYYLEDYNKKLKELYK